MTRILLAVLMATTIVASGAMASILTSVQESHTASAGSPVTTPTLAGGYDFSLLVCSDGTLWSMGRNQNGQLGQGDYTERPTPTRVGSTTNWKAVDAQYFHSVGVRADGTLWGWGHNGYGQLGLGYTSSAVISPTQVGGGTNWVAVSTGRGHSLGLRSDGTLWAWGENESGQLGQGDTADRFTPTQVGSRTDWKAVSGRWDHSLALRSDGTLWAWGYNGSGELGLGDKYTRYSPTQVGSNNDWVSIAGDFSYSLGIRSDRTLWSWGLNYNGILGLGDEIDRSVPTRVGSATNWVAVGPGRVHCLGLRSDGTLWAWGSNYEGELGTGDTAVRTSPTQVGSDSDWLAAAAGDAHSIGWRTTGTLWGWGRNQYGQLGIGGTTFAVLSPTQADLSTEPPPSVTTLAATGVSATAATLNGNLTGLGSASSAQVSFEWGLTTSYGNTTPSQTMTATGPFSGAVSGLSPGSTYHFRAKAEGDGSLYAYGGDMTFTTGAALTPPLVTTVDAGSITASSAILNGYLTSMGTASSVSVFFQWGRSPGVYYDETIPEPRNSTGAFSFNLSALSSGTTYYYRARADGDGDPVDGLERSFTTGGVAPSVTTVDASNISTSSATLNGNLTSLGTSPSVSVSFEWGTSSGTYAYETAREIKTSNGVFRFDLGNLPGAATLYYRAKAMGDQTSYGMEKSLTTVAPPTVRTNGVTSITTISARLNGELASLASATSVAVSFIWGTSPESYPYETAGQTMESAGAFYFDLGNLTPGTTYHYKAKADSGGEAVYGLEKTFTTGLTPVIESTVPERGNRGAVLTLTLSGANFDGATSVRFGSGITVRSFTVVSNTKITSEIAINPDAEVGARDVSVTTAWGTGTKTDGFSVTGAGGGVCGSAGPVTPGAASEMITTIVALGILLGAWRWLVRRARQGNVPV